MLQANEGQLERESGPRRERITARAIVVGLLLSIGFAFAIPYIDVYMSDTFLGACHLPPGAIFALLALVLVVNPLLRLLRRHWALGRLELLMVYCMLLFSTLVPGHGAENVFIPVAATPRYYATAENKWEDLFFHYIPDWFAPTDQGVTDAFFEGLHPGARVPWAAWLKPLAAWTLFSFLTYGLVLSLSVMFRAQWVDRERIAFPLVPLPMEMVSSTERPLARGTFFGNAAMWVGFGLAVLLQLMNGMHFYFPQWPSIPMFYNLQPLFRNRPWNAVGWVPGYVWPVVVGLTPLLRSEVSFSLWFFYWLDRLQLVVASMMGQLRWEMTVWGKPGWLGFQPVGGYVMYVVLAFWAARRHFRDIFPAALGQTRGLDDSREAIPYRRALSLGIACFFGMVTWAVTAGMAVSSALAQILIYIVLAVALTKVVAESGLLFVQATMSAMETMVTFAGTSGVGARSLTVATFIERAYMTDLRAFIMPSFMQGFKIADLTGMNKRRMLAAIVPAVVIATVCSYYMNIRLCYAYGGLKCNRWYVQGAGPGGFRLLANYLQAPRRPSVPNIIALLVGASVTWGMFAARQRIVWFYFHPVGYIMALTYPMTTLWLSVFIGWLLKTVIMHYFGPKVFVRTLPFFLGIAFGDIFMMVAWLIVDAITGTHSHYLMPG